jgi:hypothetical protein
MPTKRQRRRRSRHLDGSRLSDVPYTIYMDFLCGWSGPRPDCPDYPQTLDEFLDIYDSVRLEYLAVGGALPNGRTPNGQMSWAEELWQERYGNHAGVESAGCDTRQLSDNNETD